MATATRFLSAGVAIMLAATGCTMSWREGKIIAQPEAAPSSHVVTTTKSTAQGSLQSFDPYLRFTSVDGINSSRLPDDAKAYLSSRFTEAVEKLEDSPVITIKKYRSDGWMSGGITYANNPNLNALIWHRTEAGWAETLEYQSEPSCADVIEKQIPQSMITIVGCPQPT